MGSKSSRPHHESTKRSDPGGGHSEDRNSCLTPGHFNGSSSFAATPLASPNGESKKHHRRSLQSVSHKSQRRSTMGSSTTSLEAITSLGGMPPSAAAAPAAAAAAVTRSSSPGVSNDVSPPLSPPPVSSLAFSSSLSQLPQGATVVMPSPPLAVRHQSGDALRPTSREEGGSRGQSPAAQQAVAERHAASTRKAHRHVGFVQGEDEIIADTFTLPPASSAPPQSGASGAVLGTSLNSTPSDPWASTPIRTGNYYSNEHKRRLQLRKARAHQLRDAQQQQQKERPPSHPTRPQPSSHVGPHPSPQMQTAVHVSYSNPNSVRFTSSSPLARLTSPPQSYATPSLGRSPGDVSDDSGEFITLEGVIVDASSATPTGTPHPEPKGRGAHRLSSQGEEEDRQDYGEDLVGHRELARKAAERYASASAERDGSCATSLPRHMSREEEAYAAATASPAPMNDVPVQKASFGSRSVRTDTASSYSVRTMPHHLNRSNSPPRGRPVEEARHSEAYAVRQAQYRRNGTARTSTTATTTTAAAAFAGLTPAERREAYRRGHPRIHVTPAAAASSSSNTAMASSAPSERANQGVPFFLFFGGADGHRDSSSSHHSHQQNDGWTADYPDAFGGGADYGGCVSGDTGFSAF